ncbi:MAG: OmpH family outer membrane protein [Bacteroidota bacterium]
MMLQRFNLIVGLLCLAGLIFLASYLFTSRQKFVYVDSAKLVGNYKGMQDARAAYQQKAAVWKANIDTLAGEVQQQIFKYEKESPKMSAKERQLSQELIRTKQQQLAEYQQAMNTKAQQEDATMTKQVVEQINAYLKKYGKEKGYPIIFAATEYGNIAYAEDGLDITDVVLEGLNKEYAGK